MAAISDLPMPNDMDADYSPQYIKLARILRHKITSGQYKHGDPLTASGLVREHKVSVQVALHALETLAANSYIGRAGDFKPHHVTWDTAPGERQAHG